MNVELPNIQDNEATQLALDQIKNAVGYGTPQEGLAANLILIVLSVVATFISFGATAFLVVFFGFLFVMNLLRLVIPRFDDLFPNGSG